MELKRLVSLYGSFLCNTAQVSCFPLFADEMLGAPPVNRPCAAALQTKEKSASEGNRRKGLSFSLALSARRLVPGRLTFARATAA